MIKGKQSADLQDSRNLLTPDNCTVGSGHWVSSAPYITGTLLHF